MNYGVEILENARFKRLYLVHGEVQGFSVENGKGLLTLDIPSRFYKTNAKATNIGSITITKTTGNKVGTKITLSITEINDKMQFITEVPQENAPVAGDFYEFSKVICIENPHLMSGFLEGIEDQLSNLSYTSGLNLFVSSQNSPYEEGLFLGTYVLKNKSTKIITSEEDSTLSNNVLDIDSTGLANATVGMGMFDTKNSEWCFYGDGVSESVSSTYKNDNRYKEVELSTPNEEGSITEYQLRNTATSDEVSQFIENSSFVRVEITKGGYRTSQNWQSQCLTNSYIKIKGNYFKILAHVGFNIIDVSIKSIDGKATFDPLNDKEYSILNQYAWMINENYFDTFSTDNKGVTDLFEGNVISVSGNSVEISTKDPIELLKQKDGFTLAERYKGEINLLTSNMVKLYDDQQGWRLVHGNTAELITSCEFGDVNEDGTYKITIQTEGTTLEVGESCYITFDIPFTSLDGKYTKNSNYIFDLSAAGGESQNLGIYVVSDVLCLDGFYDSPAYKLDVPDNTRIGVCDGIYFGISGNGSAQDWEGVVIFATTPDTIGIGMSSFFNKLTHEGWIAYKDIITERVTIRKGALDFTEKPEKNMIVLGEEGVRESLGETGSLNKKYEWLRRIQLSVPESSEFGTMFATGTKNNIYGFYVSGDGDVDLGLLKLKNNNLPKGTSTVAYDSSDFTSTEGYPVSPVYVYSKAAYSSFDQTIIDIGVETENGPLFLLGPGSGMQAEYVNDNQTVKAQGFFDIIRLPHGETILLYDTPVGEFKIDDVVNNSDTNGSQWDIDRAIMCTGTYDETYSWSAPLANRMDDAKNLYQYPVMLMNSVYYLSYILDRRTSDLNIFTRCYEDGIPYIGCYTMSVSTILNNIALGTSFSSDDNVSTNDLSYNFLYRTNLTSDTSWTKNIISDGAGVSGEQKGMDKFTRVMGTQKTKSQFTVTEDYYSTISTHLFPDGTRILLYDGDGDGVKALFSIDGGYTWTGNSIILAKDATSGFLLGEYLVFIKSDGIYIKTTSYFDFSSVRDLQKNAGKDARNNETQMQDSIDKIKVISTGSGAVDPQKLSGYIALDGTLKIFFYTKDNLLKGVCSKDLFTWEVLNNF